MSQKSFSSHQVASLTLGAETAAEPIASCASTRMVPLESVPWTEVVKRYHRLSLAGAARSHRKRGTASIT